MSRSSFAAILFASLVTIPAASRAQEGTTVSLTVGPSVVNFTGFGGSLGAAVMQLSVRRDFTRSVGGELTVFTVAPTGGYSAIPGCVQGSPCETRSTPNVLFGVMPSVYNWLGGTNLRLSAGGGFAGAAGGEGFEHRNTLAGLLGIDWVPRSRNRMVPTFAFRVVQLSRPIAGARQLLLPGVGLAF
jgi:hypothetical protein